MPISTLVKLIRRHPDGVLYCTADAAEPRVVGGGTPRPRRKSAEEYEIKLLLRHFPQARGILFIPFWNSNLSRWTVCLAYTTSDFCRFSHEIEFFFALAFCNCIKAEIDRLVTAIADQQKSGFIGSVSHELRSPLHGILAACEFLSDTPCSPFQRSLVDTAESCAHTLLDTIDMVLDYSKINTFSRDPQGVEKSSENKPSVVVSSGSEPYLNIWKNVNLVAITEEVIEGIATGHLSKSKRPDITGSSTLKRAVDLTEGEQLGDPGAASRPNVEIIVDIAPPSKWCFVTQPGAFRRVVMNLFGNALKYTEKGYIRVLLRFKAPESGETMPDERQDEAKSENRNVMITLTVEDSGIGMSQKYLQSKVFTPFAQENNMAPGTGLGLSLVRNIVQMLEGDIKIKSQKDVGTTVTVTLPMKQSGQSTKDSTSPGTEQRSNDDSVTQLQSLQHRPQVGIYQDGLPGDTPTQVKGTEMLRKAIGDYVHQWFGFPILNDWSADPPPDILCVDEVHLPFMSERHKLFAPDSEDGPALVVLCDNASRNAALVRDIDYRHLHVISRPFGPHKLARIFVSALKGLSRKHPASLADPENDGGEETAGMSPSLEHKKTSRDLSGDELAPIEITTFDALPTGTRVTDHPGGGVALPTLSLTDLPPSATPGSIPPTRTGGSTSYTQALSSALAAPRPHLNHGHKDLPSLHRSKSTNNIPTRPEQREARLLLVDDNHVNLNLLRTFLVKRGYQSVTLAEDGQQAVDTYADALKAGTPHDVIFMDLSMPIMDGFEATRRIRRLEATNSPRRDFSDTALGGGTLADGLVAQQALTIALTGNASGKDQSDAFTSGLDLYMTKPVSFKEVGKLLDLWESKGGASSAGRARAAVLAEDGLGG